MLTSFTPSVVKNSIATTCRSRVPKKPAIAEGTPPPPVQCFCWEILRGRNGYLKVSRIVAYISPVSGIFREILFSGGTGHRASFFGVEQRQLQAHWTPAPRRTQSPGEVSLGIFKASFQGVEMRISQSAQEILHRTYPIPA